MQLIAVPVYKIYRIKFVMIRRGSCNWFFLQSRPSRPAPSTNQPLVQRYSRSANLTRRKARAVWSYGDCGLCLDL